MKISLVALTIYLFLPNSSLFAQVTTTDEQIDIQTQRDLEKQIQAQIDEFQAEASRVRRAEIANIGKLGKLRANNVDYFIFSIEPHLSLHPVDGLHVLTMDKNHSLYTSLFSGASLKQRGLDKMGGYCEA